LLLGSELPPEPFFSGPGLDRADALRADDAALQAFTTSPDALQLEWRDGLPSLSDDGHLVWAKVTRPELFLGLDGQSPRFSAIEPVAANAFSAFPLMTLLDDGDAPLFAAAMSLGRWHSRHAFCANCGHSTVIVRGGWSRRCANCGAEHFPRVDPVVIMLAEHDGRLLLGRHPQYPQGRYSALAGFVELGESIEDCIHREVREEVGVEVDNLVYFASQSWPFPHSLMIAFTAEYASGEARPCDAEIADVQWFSIDALPQLPSPVSISRKLIDATVAQLARTQALRR